eukprot:6419268-Amphidinium_carterae.1
MVVSIFNDFALDCEHFVSSFCATSSFGELRLAIIVALLKASCRGVVLSICLRMTAFSADG